MQKETSMSEALIVAARRSPIGTSFKGSLVDVSAFELASQVVADTIERVGAPLDAYDDFALGESLYGGGVIGRYVAIANGLTSTPAYGLNRWCASGLTAIQHGAAGIRAGMNDLVLAGGTQSSSTAPVYRRRVLGTDDQWEDPWLTPSHPDSPEAPNEDMGYLIGWNVAQQTGITREEMDEWALRSHQRAIASIDRGDFVDEIVPINYSTRTGERAVFSVDEHPRRSTSLEKLASLKPLHPEIDGFSITAGNSSGVNDGAAIAVLASERAADEHGLVPLAIVRSWAAVGVPPVSTGLSPTVAIPKALAKAGVAVGDIKLFEINEAYADVPIAASRKLDIDPQILNVNGSGCSLGHPVAATGTRMVVTMIGELRRRGGGLGVVAMCSGGGMGAAAVLEVL
jgi:acetyl-CoA acetyltransferase family protein